MGKGITPQPEMEICSLTIRNNLPERQDRDIEHDHAPALARRRELLDVERRDGGGEPDTDADDEAAADLGGG